MKRVFIVFLGMVVLCGLPVGPVAQGFFATGTAATVGNIPFPCPMQHAMQQKPGIWFTEYAKPVLWLARTSYGQYLGSSASGLDRYSAVAAERLVV